MREDIEKNVGNKEFFILCNHAGLKWEAISQGEFFSATPEYSRDDISSICTKNRSEKVDAEFLKQTICAIIRQNIHLSIDAVNKLCGDMGVDEFEIGYDEVIDLLKNKVFAENR